LAIGFRDAIAKYGFPTASALYNTYDDACQARFVMSSPQSDEKSGRILRKAMVSVLPQLAKRPRGLLLGRPGGHEHGPAGARG